MTRSLAVPKATRLRSLPNWVPSRAMSLACWAMALLAADVISAQGNNDPSTKAPSAQVAPGDRPNIVLIMADDMGFECVGANGGRSYETPHLDRLAAAGMRFEHCYSQPICTPSRVQLMTGLYNSRNYVRFGLLKPDSYTFGNALRGAGYATCVVGKWQLQGGLEGPGRFGFDEYCLWQLTRRPNRYPNPGLEINGEPTDFNNGEYGPDIVSDYACDFIERQAQAGKPFFLYYPMMLPHWPFEPTPASPEWDPLARRGDKSERGNGTKTTEFFDDMVRYVDRIVGKLAAKLDEQGVGDNTLLIFTGDNGTFPGITSKFKDRDWRGGKGHMTDNGTHVPLIVHWPGTIDPGQTNGDLIDFSDMLPTLADVGRAELPPQMTLDGRSFLPQLRGERGHPREAVYCWYFRNGKPARGGANHTAGESARDRRYKLYLGGGLFDTEQDFYEQSPLPAEQWTTQQQQIHDRLQGVLDAHTREGFYSPQP
jgi:arylsulfatase A